MYPSVASSRALFASAGLMAAIVVAATAVACGSDDSTAPVNDPTFVATLTGAGEFPATASPGTGTATIVRKNGSYTYTIAYSGLSGPLTGGHIHGPAAAGANATVVVPFNTTGAGASGTLTGTFASTSNVNITNDSLDVLMRTWNAYVNLHTDLNKGGEIRGQLSQQQ